MILVVATTAAILWRARQEDRRENERWIKFRSLWITPEAKWMTATRTVNLYTIVIPRFADVLRTSIAVEFQRFVNNHHANRWPIEQ